MSASDSTASGDSAGTAQACADSAETQSNEKPDGPQSYAWVWVCLFLLAVTWTPVFGIHIYRTALGDASTGTVVVVFPPTLSTKELFRSVLDANGSIVRPVRWFPRMWVARSVEPGFVGRLKQSGAWGVYSTDFLEASALLSCIRIVGSPAPPAPGDAGSTPPAT